MDLHTPLSSASRVYKMYAKRLEKLGITTFGDFLLHLPFRYDDFSLISPINTIQEGEVVTIQGTLLEIKNEFTKRYKKLQKAKVQDTSGTLDVLWFNQMFITTALHPGDRVSLSGRVEHNGHSLVLIAPTYEVLDITGKSIHTGRLVPIYPETAGVSSKWLRRQVYNLLSQPLSDYLPQSIRASHGYLDYPTALSYIHFPDTLEDAQSARARLAFDEVFLIQLGAIKRRHEWKQHSKGNTFTITEHQKALEKIFKSLSFELTDAQNRAIHEIFQDLSGHEPMNRLLQGDVGSGKTVVGAIAMYLAHLNGFQSVLMAPTQILAQQHYQTIKKLLEPLGVRVELRTGSTKGIKPVIASITKQSRQSKKIATSQVPRNDERGFDILIGTHAVLSEKINFDRLGLVIIDEQQRFGVTQRSLIREKGTNPHLLTMTATPIPRTVALTLYGDLDMSVLNEMPVGRLKIKTWLVPPEKREGAYGWIEKQVKEGNQAFIVCPFIEESETVPSVKAAAVEFERLQKTIFPTLTLGLLHGRQKAKEKDEVLQNFRDKKIDILVATPVVEVGIDIPNATIIVIEAADRFGLAQLHQLRGRVGRGDQQSYCLLFTDSKQDATAKRLKAMETMHSGAVLAELDLKMRGAGELYGTLQHGRRWLKIASFGDIGLIENAKQEAIKIFPELGKYPDLLKKLEETILGQVAPD